MYEVWNALEEAASHPVTAASKLNAVGHGSGRGKATAPGADEWVVRILLRMRESHGKALTQEIHSGAVAKRPKTK